MAAGEVFAEQGFQAATVREISNRVGANVAAVNYHFRDKLGLYIEVLKRSLMAEQDEELHLALARIDSPQGALRAFIAAMLARTFTRSEMGFQFRIMAQEMAQPTPALRQVVEEVIQPKFLVLREIIGRIVGLPADDARTRLCAHGVVGQVMHFANSQPVIGLLWPGWEAARHLDEIAEHIYLFTLSGLSGMAERGKE